MSRDQQVGELLRGTVAGNSTNKYCLPPLGAIVLYTAVAAQ